MYGGNGIGDIDNYEEDRKRRQQEREERERKQREEEEREEREEEARAKARRNRILGGSVVAIILFIAIIFLCLILVKIDAGYVGVVYSPNGGIQEKTLGQGWHVIKPGQRCIEYSIGIEQSYLTATEEGDSEGDDSFSAPSKDGKGLTMELTFTYRFDESRVAEIFVTQKGRDGLEVLKTFIKPNVISWTKEVTATYPVSEILGEKRAELNTVVSDYLAKKFEPYGIIIENASLINITTDDETKAAIDKKIKAQQELEVSKTEAETAKINAQKDKEVAIINAEQQKETALIEAERNKETATLKAQEATIRAQGEADALKIKSEAEAAANKVIAESLTPQLIEKMKYEAWDGKLPTVQGNGTPILDMTE